MIILGGTFAVIWIVLNLLLYLIIVKRVNRIAAKSERIAKGDMGESEFEQTGKDELSSLGHSFNLMYRSLSSAVKLLNRTQA